jgi:hypothetical protein
MLIGVVILLRKDLFAHLKRIIKLDRLRLRQLIGLRDEFLMAAMVERDDLQNCDTKPPDRSIGAL